MRDVPMSEHTRWRIGGHASALGRASTEDEVRGLLAELDGQRVWVLGLGANLLISDDGPPGPVLVLEGEFKEFELLESTIRVGAAAPISAVVQNARRHARSGLWILEAVPGTMGGALRMNAGTAEEWLWDRVLWADAIWPDGHTERFGAVDVGPSYRAIQLDEEAIFLRAEISAPHGDAARINNEHELRRSEKLAAQVYDQPTCGSTWKNPDPPALSAWELVDKVGMRGERRGGAQISPKHANFIVNTEGARAQDVVELMVETRRRVYTETGVELEPEIHFWGFPDQVLSELGVKA